MRGGKSSIDTQNNLVKSIKQGIKQAVQHNTSKELNTSFFTKFHSPKDGYIFPHAKTIIDKSSTNNIAVSKFKPDVILIAKEQRWDMHYWRK